MITPRVFEAIALQTPLVMFPGEFNGILKAHRHYIVLERDFSNVEDVMSKITDENYLKMVADRAFREIGKNPEYGFENFVKRVEAALERELLNRGYSISSNNLNQANYTMLHNLLTINKKSPLISIRSSLADFTNKAKILTSKIIFIWSQNLSFIEKIKDTVHLIRRSLRYLVYILRSW